MCEICILIYNQQPLVICYSPLTPLIITKSGMNWPSAWTLPWCLSKAHELRACLAGIAPNLAKLSRGHRLFSQLMYWLMYLKQDFIGRPVTHFTYNWRAHYSNLVKQLLLLLEKWCLIRVAILHMPRQQSCRDMCKSVTWSDYLKQN